MKIDELRSWGLKVIILPTTREMRENLGDFEEEIESLDFLQKKRRNEEGNPPHNGAIRLLCPNRYSRIEYEILPQMGNAKLILIQISKQRAGQNKLVLLSGDGAFREPLDNGIEDEF
jgi:hypothetical protein